MCCTCVDQSSVEVIETFGKFSRIAYPGFNAVWCCIGERVAGGLSLRIQQLDVRCETKTKDNVFVDFVVSVQYQVVRESLYDAFYKLTDSRSQITAYVFDEVRATVPRMVLDDVFMAKEDIAMKVKEELQKSMTAFGFQVLNVLVTDIEPAAKVKAAMNEINAAQRLRLAAYEQSEADKVRIVKAAEADAEAKYLSGQGVARQRQAIIAGLRESVQMFSQEVNDVNSRDVMELLMITQYMASGGSEGACSCTSESRQRKGVLELPGGDMLKDIGLSGKSSTVFMPHSPGALGDLASQIRSGFMQASAGTEGLHQVPPPQMRR
ncbi:hypersensitive-induced response 1 [Micractinium conductrix]|uniref:Hypersensitive-induced response 1 n=1 Tax=Micractinium conductrix TaxID=554055 RepID=A0A2P6VG71_9CHLO|nr:hypersensitive-induced response 1 [Micractinium conductrix]|eukprot:PSC73089.1 hypersensitive-induced response 1 [Micractinium conductrix]